MVRPRDLARVRLGYSGIRIYSGIYSGYSDPGSRIAGMEIQVFRNENSSQTNAYLHYSNYCYSVLIPNERTLSMITLLIILSSILISISSHWAYSLCIDPIIISSVLATFKLNLLALR